ncbi:sensor of ECF-type sigma factor [uncultured Kordia sp.]|uniref:sensor of ECF-type sigma factor n=1 Tax=uncultured Kordia sp. TaxID=507699 RepID=UPI002602658E|nr:sensor of ECF-type sigma factor [uncultured Kordia sp.]
MSKKLYTTLLLLFLGLSFGFAQKHERGQKHQEKIKKLKIAYFTENLNLTAEEAQQFWPIYNAYDDKNHDLRVKGFYKIKKEVKDIEQMSETEAQEVLARLEALETQVYENNQDLMRKLKKILPAKKIIQLKKAERDFNRKLMKEFRKKRRE